MNIVIPAGSVLQPLHIAVHTVSMVLLLGPRGGPEGELTAVHVRVCGHASLQLALLWDLGCCQVNTYGIIHLFDPALSQLNPVTIFTAVHFNITLSRTPVLPKQCVCLFP
jgi:hypothetical protein